MSVTIVVDDHELKVQAGQSVLQACLENDIYIPNLCFMEEMNHPPASCRLCFVEVEGSPAPITSCTVKVTGGMVIKTDTPAVRRLQRSALRFLLSVHDVDCKNCPANKKCELQRLARFLKTGLKSKGLEKHLQETALVDDHPQLDYYPNRCVLCGRCIFVCRVSQGRPLISFVGRGFHTSLSLAAGRDDDATPCTACGRCADVCPVGALVLKTAGEP